MRSHIRNARRFYLDVLNNFEIGTRLLTRTDSGISDFDDLRGKNVVVSAGTTSERLLRTMNEEKGMDMNIISAKDYGEAFVTLEFDRAVALMSDDAILYGEKTNPKDGGRRPPHLGSARRSPTAMSCCRCPSGSSFRRSRPSS